MSDWLIDDAGIDFSRRYFTQFINPFPDAYADKILKPSYQPSMAGFMDDYLAGNPTRNRALDLLPVLSEVDLDRVKDRVNPDEKSLVKGRPAFHYRLPDCRLGDPGWSIAGEWNRWFLVETVANDPDMRHELMALREKHSGETIFTRKKSWVEAVDSVLHRIRPDHGAS